MIDDPNLRDGLGRGMRAWVESVPTSSPEEVRGRAGRRRRERRRRRVAIGVLSSVIAAVTIVSVVGLSSTDTSNDRSNGSMSGESNRPKGCFLSADTFGGSFADEVASGRASLFGLPSDAIVSVVEGNRVGGEGVVDVISVDDPTAVSETQIEALRNADHRDVLVIERCGDLGTISALASALQDSILESGSTIVSTSVRVEADDRRGLVVITGPRVIADQLVSAANGDASLVEFRATAPAQGD